MPDTHSYIVLTNPGYSSGVQRSDTRVDGVASLHVADGWLSLEGPEGETLLMAPTSQVGYVKRVETSGTNPATVTYTTSGNVQVPLDGKAIHAALLKLKRDGGNKFLGLA